MNREGLISVLLASKKHGIPRMRLHYIIKRAGVPILRDATGHPYVNEVELDNALQNHANRLNKHQRLQAARQAKRKQTLVDTPPEGWLSVQDLVSVCVYEYSHVARIMKRCSVPYCELPSRKRYFEPGAAKAALKDQAKTIAESEGRLTAKALAKDYELNRNYVTSILNRANVTYITIHNARYYDAVEADDAIAEHFATRKYQKRKQLGAA